MYCNHCSRQWDPEFTYCQACGSTLSPNPQIASSAGSIVDDDMFVIDMPVEDVDWEEPVNRTIVPSPSQSLVYPQTSPNQPIRYTQVNNHYYWPGSNSSLNDVEKFAAGVVVGMIGLTLMVILMRWLIIMSLS